jgi:hypothetical protein
LQSIHSLSESIKEVALSHNVSHEGPNYITPATVLYDFDGDGVEELIVKEGDQVLVEDPIEEDDGWVRARNVSNGKEGLIPRNYVEVSLLQCYQKRQLNLMLDKCHKQQ